jgi:hypothetical protein
VKLITLILLVLFSVGGCASVAPVCLPESIELHDSVLAKAKVDSKVLCSTSPYGCEYTVTHTDGWVVNVARISSVKDGLKYSAIGDDIYYVYNCFGEFEKSIPGL